MSIALFILSLFFPTPPSAPRLPFEPAPLVSRTVTVKTNPVPAAELHPPLKLPTYRVTATIYTADANQTDAEPLITADNSRIPPRASSKTRWIALSRDLLEKWGGPFAFGDSVRVRGISPELDGTYIIHDTMNRRIRRGIDLLVGKHEDFYGKWKDVRITPVPVRPPQEPVWQAG